MGAYGLPSGSGPASLLAPGHAGSSNAGGQPAERSAKSGNNRNDFSIFHSSHGQLSCQARRRSGLDQVPSLSSVSSLPQLVAKSHKQFPRVATDTWTPALGSWG